MTGNLDLLVLFVGSFATSFVASFVVGLIVETVNRAIDRRDRRRRARLAGQARRRKLGAFGDPTPSVEDQP